MWQQRAGKPVAEATMERGSSDPQPPVLPTLFVVFPISVFTFHLVISNQPFLGDYSRSQLAKVTGSLALCLLVKKKRERECRPVHMLITQKPLALQPAQASCPQVQLPCLARPRGLSPEVSPWDTS